MRYRNDIEGLRAVAVILIVFYHARLTSVPGGFIGVDVFFVISGFLITNLILRDLADDRFSFRSFYMRRLRRLGPALLATVALSLVAAWFVLPPTLYQQTAQSALATVLSVSNFFFWQQSGYFDTSAYYKPLLHTWSLAVEEQFYLIWPLFLLVMMRWRGKSGLLAAIAILSAVSLILSEAVLDTDPSAAFFLTPFRIYEFSIGAVLALTGLQARNRAIAYAASLGGLGLIFYLAAEFSDATAFPGVNAAIPALATALMIYAGPDAIMNRALAMQPIRYIGKISYSVYLVHWPLVVFSLFVIGEVVTTPAVIGLLGVTFLTGALMYHLIEAPFRIKRGNSFAIKPAILGWGSLATAVVLGIASWQIHSERGYPARFPPDTMALLAELDAAIAQRALATGEWTCNATANSGPVYFQGFSDCLPDADDNLIVVLGDSHAADVFMGLQGAFPDQSFVQLTGNGCNLTKQIEGGLFCAQFMQHWQTWLNQNADKIDAVIFTQSGGSLVTQGAGGRKRPDPIQLRSMIANLERFVPSQLPLFFWGPRASFQPSIDIGIINSATRTDLAAFYGGRRDATNIRLDAALEQYLADSPVAYLSTTATLCRNGCPALTRDGALFVVDYGHWSVAGAQEAASRMVAAHPALQAILHK